MLAFAAQASHARYEHPTYVNVTQHMSVLGAASDPGSHHSGPTHTGPEVTVLVKWSKEDRYGQMVSS